MVCEAHVNHPALAIERERKGKEVDHWLGRINKLNELEELRTRTVAEGQQDSQFHEQQTGTPEQLNKLTYQINATEHGRTAAHRVASTCHMFSLGH